MKSFKRKGVVHFGHLQLGVGQDDWWSSADVKARGRIEGLVLLRVLCRVSVIEFKSCHV